MRLGLKRNETREWKTDFRGDLVILAAKTTAHADFIFHDSVAAYFRAKDLYRRTQLLFGCMACVVELYDCKKVEEVDLTACERAFGNYVSPPGKQRYAWLTRNLRLVDPIAFKGKQGFIHVPESSIRYAEAT